MEALATLTMFVGAAVVLTLWGIGVTLLRARCTVPTWKRYLGAVVVLTGGLLLLAWPVAQKVPVDAGDMDLAALALTYGPSGFAVITFVGGALLGLLGFAAARERAGLPN